MLNHYSCNCKKHKEPRTIEMRTSHVIKELGCINCNHILSLNFRTNEVHRRFFLLLPIHQLPCNFCIHCSCENSMNASKKSFENCYMHQRKRKLQRINIFFVYLKIAKQDYLYALYLMDELKYSRTVS